MKIKKCIIPAAWMWTRFLPATKSLPKEMFPIVDKPVIQLLVEEAVSAWCEEIIIVTSRWKKVLEDHFDANIELEKRLFDDKKEKYLEIVKWVTNLAKIYFVRQAYPKGDWDAILRAKSFIWDEPFLVLFWDDLVDYEKTASEQLVSAFEKTNSPVIATINVSDREVSSYWIIESKENSETFLVEKFLEKPKSDETKSRNWVIWKYVLTSEIFDYLEKSTPINDDWETRLADAFELMRKEKNIYWVQIKGERYDTWNKFWYLKANIAYWLKNQDTSLELKEYIKNLAKNLD